MCNSIEYGQNNSRKVIANKDTLLVTKSRRGSVYGLFLFIYQEAQVYSPFRHTNTSDINIFNMKELQFDNRLVNWRLGLKKHSIESCTIGNLDLSILV